MSSHATDLVVYGTFLLLPLCYWGCGYVYEGECEVRQKTHTSLQIKHWDTLGLMLPQFADGRPQLQSSHARRLKSQLYRFTHLCR